MGQVLADRILITPIPEEKHNTFYVSGDDRNKPSRGTVDQVGKDVIDVKAGDTIMFGINAGTDVKIDGQQKKILREVEVYYIF